MVRCAITDRKIFSGDERQQRWAVVRQAARWAAEGLEFVQLREKDLPAHDLEVLAAEVVSAVRQASHGCQAGAATRVLLNGRADVALAVEADGVHLTSAPGELTPAQVRQLFAAAGRPGPMVGVSCHTLAEIERASAAGASFALFGPVFEKRVLGELVQPGTGLELLRQACQQAGTMPVLALGGVTQENTAACQQAGAAGVAGIRLFL
jgi:thiamine-phosphate pyrophosphorylase